MQHLTSDEIHRTRSVLRVGFLVAIIVMTVLGVVLGYTVDSALEGGLGWLVAGVLAVLTVTNVFLVNAVLLPKVAKTSVDPLQPATIGYAFSESPAIFGLVSGLLTGVGVIAIPFGLVAMVSLGMVENFLSDAYRDTLREPGA